MTTHSITVVALMVTAVTTAAAQTVPTIPVGDDTPKPADFNRTIPIGPLKFAFGPQDNGGFGATLKGTTSKRIALFNNLINVNPKPNSVQWGRYGTFDFDLDSGWSSEAGALNNASISLKPRVTFVHLKGRDAPIKRREASPEDHDKCVQLDADMTAAAAAGDSEARNRIILRADKECDSWFVPIDENFAVSLYPDLLYRFGRFEVNGAQYDANQAIIGIGARLFLPATIGDWLTTWPYISIGYYDVQETSDSSVPVPDEIKANYATVDAQLSVYLPYPEVALSASPLQGLVSLKASIPTKSDGDRQFLRHLQLSYDTGTAIKPAITYRSGKDQGLEYDKQLILGLVWDLLAQEN